MTPQEFISKWAGENTRANELMQDDFASVIAAAVAAEHQRTLDQCAASECSICADEHSNYNRAELIDAEWVHQLTVGGNVVDSQPCAAFYLHSLP